MTIEFSFFSFFPLYESKLLPLTACFAILALITTPVIYWKNKRKNKISTFCGKKIKTKTKTVSLNKLSFYDSTEVSALGDAADFANASFGILYGTQSSETTIDIITVKFF